MRTHRRNFLKSSSVFALTSAISAEAYTDLNRVSGIKSSGSWDSGIVKHILPIVSDTQML